MYYFLNECSVSTVPYKGLTLRVAQVDSGTESSVPCWGNRSPGTWKSDEAAQSVLVSLSVSRVRTAGAGEVRRRTPSLSQCGSAEEGVARISGSSDMAVSSLVLVVATCRAA